jgi:hypothetical protein
MIDQAQSKYYVIKAPAVPRAQGKAASLGGKCGKKRREIQMSFLGETGRSAVAPSCSVFAGINTIELVSCENVVPRGLRVRETRERKISKGKQRQLSKGNITPPTSAWSSD